MLDRNREIKNKEEYRGKDDYEEYKNKKLIQIYIDDEILKVEKDTKTPAGKHVGTRLLGLHDAVFISNKNIKPQANYSYELILLTLK